MSRSPRRRKDCQWCRGCDSERVDRNGYGRCRYCNAITIKKRNPQQRSRAEG